MSRARRRAADGRVRVAAMAFIEMVGTVVGHAGDDDHLGVAVQRDAIGRHGGRTLMVQHPVFVHQHLHAQAAQFCDPGMRAGVVLMVAGDEEAAVGGHQARQRRHMRPQVVDTAVDQVAGDGHHVGTQRIDTVDDALHVGVADRRADMDVGDLGDAEAVQGFGQAGDGDVDPHHRRGAPGVPETPGGGQQREHGHGGRAAR